jgi:hypothetical protein
LLPLSPDTAAMVSLATLLLLFFPLLSPNTAPCVSGCLLLHARLAVATRRSPVDRRSAELKVRCRIIEADRTSYLVFTFFLFLLVTHLLPDIKRSLRISNHKFETNPCTSAQENCFA